MEHRGNPLVLSVPQARQPEAQPKQRSPILGFVLWFLGLAGLGAAAWTVHGHPHAWPFDLAFSQGLQAWSLPAWISAAFTAITTFNDPIPSGIAAAVLIIFLLIKRWIRPALFLGYLVLVANSIDA